MVKSTRQRDRFVNTCSTILDNTVTGVRDATRASLKNIIYKVIWNGCITSTPPSGFRDEVSSLCNHGLITLCRSTNSLTYMQQHFFFFWRCPDIHNATSRLHEKCFCVMLYIFSNILCTRCYSSCVALCRIWKALALGKILQHSQTFRSIGHFPGDISPLAWTREAV